MRTLLSRGDLQRLINAARLKKVAAILGDPIMEDKGLLSDSVPEYYRVTANFVYMIMKYRQRGLTTIKTRSNPSVSERAADANGNHAL